MGVLVCSHMSDPDCYSKCTQIPRSSNELLGTGNEYTTAVILQGSS